MPKNKKPRKPGFKPKKNQYVTGTGQVLDYIHSAENCAGQLCTVHNPTNQKPECDWPTHWRADRRLMERICPCGIGHPAPEHMAFLLVTMAPEDAWAEGIHGCGMGCHVEGWCEEQKAKRLAKEQQQ